jgi:hypothetical protein
MKHMATEVLTQGLTARDRTTKAACLKSLQIMRGEIPPKSQKKDTKTTSGKTKIKDIPANKPSTAPRRHSSKNH